MPAQQVAGQQYVTDPNNSRRVAHIISDAIFSRITGEKGFFDTRVVFVDETGPAENRRKRLAIMDQDGANVRYLTRGDDLVVTPRFSPSSQDVTYMAFGSGDPKVLLLNIETGQREVVGNFPGMEFAPRFSPDGQKIVMSLEENGVTNHLRDGYRLARDDAAVQFAPPSTPRPPSRPTARRSSSNPTAAASSRFTSCRRRRRRAAHLLRRRPLFDAGLVAEGRLHRLHRAEPGRIRASA